jgi:hypothetical protein
MMIYNMNMEKITKQENLDTKYNFPVWATQGGGLVREAGKENPDTYIFVTDPGVEGLTVGSVMPDEWSIVPANKLAR